MDDKYERNIIPSPRNDRPIVIDGVKSPRSSPRLFEDYDIYDLKMEEVEPEKEEIIITEEKKEEPKKKQEIDYDNLTEDEILKIRTEYELERKALMKKYGELPDYTKCKDIKKVVSIRNIIIGKFESISCINKYKAGILFVCCIIESTLKFFKIDLFEGLFESNNELIDSYDDVFMEMYNNKTLPSLYTEKDPFKLFIMTFCSTTFFILCKLVLSRFIGKEYATKTLESITKLFKNDKEISSKYVEKMIDIDHSELFREIKSLNSILDKGIQIKNSLFSDKNGNSSSRVKRPQ